MGAFPCYLFSWGQALNFSVDLTGDPPGRVLWGGTIRMVSEWSGLGNGTTGVCGPRSALEFVIVPSRTRSALSIQS